MVRVRVMVMVTVTVRVMVTVMVRVRVFMKGRTIKGLLLEMKMDDEYENRVLAEETILLEFQALEEKLKVAVETDVGRKALLINIQPIKRESASDVLRDWISFSDRSHFTVDQWKIRERAKAVLEHDDIGGKLANEALTKIKGGENGNI